MINSEFVFSRLFVGTILSLTALSAVADPTTLRATPQTELNVRATNAKIEITDSDGTKLCEVPRGTQMVANGRMGGSVLRVKLTAPGCPDNVETFADLEELMPYDDAVKGVRVQSVDGESFMRKGPGTDQKVLCSFPEGVALEVQSDWEGKGDPPFYKVRFKEKVRDCPEEGYVAVSLITPSSYYHILPELEAETETTPANSAKPQGQTCTDCERVARENPKTSAQEIQAQTIPGKKSKPFLDSIAEFRKEGTCDPYNCVIRGKKAKQKLIQLPLLGESGTIGPCGSHHYNVDRPVGIDAYARPETACTMVAFLQEWRKSCPDRAGCTISWGDVGHRKQPYFNGHKEHTAGDCFDMRPPRKGGFEDAPLTFRSSDYSRDDARKLVTLATKMGASRIYFNDSKLFEKGLPIRRMKGHDNHLHICFNQNDTTKAVCEKLKVDPQVCPEI